MSINDALLVFASYAVGCISPGYYLVRWLKGLDIRDRGTGSTGARNVGRELGLAAFVSVLLLDLAKGAVTVAAAAHFLGNFPSGVLAMLAVVAGHVYPLPLRFRGGKGVATAIGALLLYNYLILTILIGLAVLILLLSRKVVFSGLAAFTICPLVLTGLRFSIVDVAGVMGIAIIILIAHRNTIRNEIAAVDQRI